MRAESRVREVCRHVKSNHDLDYVLWSAFNLPPPPPHSARCSFGFLACFTKYITLERLAYLCLLQQQQQERAQKRSICYLTLPISRYTLIQCSIFEIHYCYSHQISMQIWKSIMLSRFQIQVALGLWSGFEVNQSLRQYGMILCGGC